jgi:hypothetical protein
MDDKAILESAREAAAAAFAEIPQTREEAAKRSLVNVLAYNLGRIPVDQRAAVAASQVRVFLDEVTPGSRFPDIDAAAAKMQLGFNRSLEQIRNHPAVVGEPTSKICWTGTEDRMAADWAGDDSITKIDGNRAWTKSGRTITRAELRAWARPVTWTNLESWERQFPRLVAEE